MRGTTYLLAEMAFWLIVAAALGAGMGWLLARWRARGRIEAVEAERDAAERRLDVLKRQVAAAAGGDDPDSDERGEAGAAPVPESGIPAAHESEDAAERDDGSADATQAATPTQD